MIERLGARRLEAAAATAFAGADGVEGAGPLGDPAIEPAIEPAIGIDLTEPMAAHPGLTVEAFLAQPPAAHLARHQDLGEGTAALTRIVSRPARPDESPAEARLREVVARYLAFRREVAEGRARISIG